MRRQTRRSIRNGSLTLCIHTISHALAAPGAAKAGLVRRAAADRNIALYDSMMWYDA